MVITSGKYYAYTACSLAFFCFHPRACWLYFLLSQHVPHFCLELDKTRKVCCFCEDFLSPKCLILFLVPIFPCVHAESVIFFLLPVVCLSCSIYLGEDLLKAECFFLCHVLSSLCILCIKSCLFLLSSRILSLQDVAAPEFMKGGLYNE